MKTDIENRPRIYMDDDLYFTIKSKHVKEIHKVFVSKIGKTGIQESYYDKNTTYFA